MHHLLAAGPFDPGPAALAPAADPDRGGMMVRFQPAGAAIIRAGSWTPGTAGLLTWPDLTSTSDNAAARWRAWLARVWQHEPLADAIELASPDLADAVRAVCDGRVSTPRRVRRAVESTLSYLLRMTTRASPFGLFAGIAPVRLGGRAAVTWGCHHRAAARPDAIWLTAVTAALEKNPESFGHMSVVLNNLSLVRGDTLVITCQPYAQAPGQAGPCEVQVRITGPVQLVLRAARTPVTIADLTSTLSAGFPDQDAPVIERMLAALVARRVLIPDLWPAMHVTDPAGHLAARGPASAAGELGAVGRDLAASWHARTRADARQYRARAAAKMTAISAQPRQPLAVDQLLDLAVTLPTAVLTQAAAAAAALVRLAPCPGGNPAWQHWHGLYLDRYGPGAIVPVTEITDPGTGTGTGTGIGYPAGYRGSPHRVPAAGLQARDKALLRLAQDAALSGCPETELDDDGIDQLTASPGIGLVFPHTELRFAIHAPAPAALDRGDFTLAVTAAARHAGTSAGRFLYLLDPAGQQAAARAFARLPTLTAGALTAQISCPPLATRTQNLTRALPVFPLIPLAEHPGPAGPAGQVIAISDLAVTGDADRLCLVSMATGRVIEPVQLNAVEFRARTHPLARFLCELPTARAAPCVPFSWGAAGGLPFLPRIRYRRAILRPATWHITAAGLPGRAAPWDQWAERWAQLREHYRIPRSVLLGDNDVLAGLDLDEPAHLALLRTHLDRNNHARLTEGPRDGDYGWIAGRPHEIVLPLASAAPPAPAPAAVTPPRPLPATPRIAHTPGISRWLYARLDAQPGQQAQILTRHLPGLLTRWPGGPPAAWFTRSRQPGPCLAIVIALPRATGYGPAARRAGAWAQDLRRGGLAGDLVLDTYRPATGQHGAGPVMGAAEAVFAADSAAAIAQLTTSHRTYGPDPVALTAASMIAIAAAFTGGTRAAMTWLTAHTPAAGIPPPGREARAQALRLADPQAGRSALAVLPGGAQLLDAWDQRDAALSSYRGSCAASPCRPDPDLALRSLLHLHHTRAIGDDDGSERTCLALARAIAVSWTARTGAHHRH